jgi:hypothetical protein
MIYHWKTDKPRKFSGKISLSLLFWNKKCRTTPPPSVTQRCLSFLLLSSRGNFLKYQIIFLSNTVAFPYIKFQFIPHREHGQCPLLVNDVCERVVGVCCENHVKQVKMQIFRRVRILAKSAYSLRHVLSSDCLSARISSAPTVRIFVRFDIGDFHLNLSRKYKFGYNRTNISGTLHEELSTVYCCRLLKPAIKALSSSEMVSGC